MNFVERADAAISTFKKRPQRDCHARVPFWNKGRSLAMTTVLFLLAACNKSPFERTRDASGGGAVGSFGSGNFVIFSNELKTGGGAFLYPSGEHQTLDFRDTSNSISQRSIRYNWDGQDVASQHAFAGFDL